MVPLLKTATANVTPTDGSIHGHGNLSHSHSRTPVRMQRLKPGMSLCTLSKLSGIAMPHLSRIFSGKRGLTVRMAKKIAEALNCPIDDVVNVLLGDQQD